MIEHGYIYFQSLLRVLPNSESEIAKEIGVSEKTLYRMKNGEYKPTQKTIKKTKEYARRLMHKLTAFDHNTVVTTYCEDGVTFSSGIR